MRTYKKVAKTASKLLKKSFSAKVKSVAGSALAQRRKKVNDFSPLLLCSRVNVGSLPTKL